MGRSLHFHILKSLLNDLNSGAYKGWGDDRIQDERQSRVSRRQVLQGLGALTAAGWAQSALPSLAHASSPDDAVAIVGAGAAGLTAAYELRKARIPFVLYEASGRIGGRIFTDHATFMSQGQFCELGAELINSTHTSIRRLAQELSIPLEDFPPGDKGLIGEVFLHNGRRYSEREIIRAARPLIRAVARDIKAIYGDKPLEVVTYRSEFAAAARKFDDMSVDEYLGSVTELEPWLRELLAAAYLVEYGTETNVLPALSFLYLFTSEETPEWKTYGSSDELSRIQGGNSRLMDAVYASMGGEEKSRFRHQLIQVRDRGSRFDLTFFTDRGVKTYKHSQAIIALPFPALREVEGFAPGRTSLALNPVKSLAIRELNFGRNTKAMLGFNERPWRHPRRGQGATGSAIANGYVSAMWETSRLQQGRAGILTHFVGGRKAVEFGADRIAATLVDFERIFPGVARVHNNRTAIMNWPLHAWTKSSYSSPSLGQYTRLFGAGHEPELSGRLLFAGEHTSAQNNGYMEGAVESGFRVAAEIMTLRGQRTPAKKTGA